VTEPGSPPKRRLVTVRRVQLVLLVAILAACVTYYAWGVRLEGRLDALLEEHRDRGVPRWEDLVESIDPETESAAALLEQAAQMPHQLEPNPTPRGSRGSRGFIGHVGRLTLDPGATAMTTEESVRWAIASHHLEPCFDLIEEASRRRVLWPIDDQDPIGQLFRQPGRDDFHVVERLLATRALHDPARAGRQVEILLAFGRPRPEASIDHPLARQPYRRAAVRLLRRSIALGAIDASTSLERMRRDLEAYDFDAELRAVARYGDTLWVWYLGELRAGREPRSFETLGRMRYKAGITPSGPDWWTLSTSPPWRWFARPVVLRDAIEILESRRSAEIPLTRTGGAYESPMVLTVGDLARHRLALLALDVLAYRRKHQALPMNLADLGAERKRYRDPFSSESLHLEVTSDGVGIHAAGSGFWNDLLPEERREQREKRGLRWTIPREKENRGR